MDDSLDIGRPDRIEVIFAGHARRWGRPPKTEPTFKTRIATRDTIGVTANAYYKHFRVKQYLKDCRALRIETVTNNASAWICKRRLEHLDELQATSLCHQRSPLTKLPASDGLCPCEPSL